VGDAISAAAHTYFSGAYINHAAELTMIKYNLIGTNGKYADPSNTVLEDHPTATVGAGNGYVWPQLALAISLRTDAARGPAHAGRFYLPCPQGAPYTDGRYTIDQVSDIVAASTAFLDAINADDASWQVAVVSNVGSGHQRFVDHVQVGRVMDTMRSRRTSLPEDPVVGATITHP
jgi:hypothetical protein